MRKHFQRWALLAPLIFIFSGFVSEHSLGRLLDKTLAIFNQDIISLSEVNRIKENFLSRNEISPQIYNPKKQSTKEIIELIIEAKIRKSKLKELGYNIDDTQVEDQVRNTEKRLGINRQTLLAFLNSKNLTFSEYFEITRNAIIQNIFFAKIITPLVQVSDQEIKNVFFKENKDKKTFTFTYDLIDYSFKAELLKEVSQTELLRQVKEYHRLNILKENFVQINKDNLNNMHEDGLTPRLLKALKLKNENEFTGLVIIDKYAHVFFIKKKDIVDSEDYIKAKKNIYNKIFGGKVQQVSKSWYQVEKDKHHIKYFFK